MTINYIGVLKADICFDYGMTYHGMNNTYHPLQEYIDKAISLMTAYGFIAAQIVDCETGEIFVELKSDYNDSHDDNSTCCDNDNTCNHE